MGESSYPMEFHVDTAEACPFEPGSEPCHLKNLWELRASVDGLAALAGTFYRDKVNFELRLEDERKQQRDLLETTVGIVDKLRRLLEDAHRHLGVERADSADASRSWLQAFGTLLAGAIDELERRDVHHVRLVGEDLRSVVFDGQPVKNWVSVLNRPSAAALVIREEVAGLWVARRDGHLIPIQRGAGLV